jgi:hypothetical protein
MSPARARLALTALLFAGWLGYLLFLVLTRPPARPGGAPVVLSRPQFLASDLDVVADVREGGRQVTVRSVEYAAPGRPPVREGDDIVVRNLHECRPPEGKDPPPDLAGDGRYILPLEPAGGAFRVVTTPPSPGFPAAAATPRIYPATDDALAQLRAIEARKRGAAAPPPGGGPG